MKRLQLATILEVFWYKNFFDKFWKCFECYLCTINACFVSFEFDILIFKVMWHEDTYIWLDQVTIWTVFNLIDGWTSHFYFDINQKYMYMYMCFWPKFIKPMSSQVQSLQKQLTQLRQEAGVNRIPVSEAIQDILSYTNQHAQDDALVIGVNQSENPFREPKPCSIL